MPWGAHGGVNWLNGAGYKVLGVSGVLTRSPLAMRGDVVRHHLFYSTRRCATQPRRAACWRRASQGEDLKVAA